MKWKAMYERRTTKNLSFYNYSSEIIDARGIVHAHRLARDHLRELRKLTSYELRIDNIFLMEKKTDDA